MSELDQLKQKLQDAISLVSDTRYAEALTLIEPLMCRFEEMEEWDLYVNALDKKGECLWRRGSTSEAYSNTLYTFEVVKEKFGEEHSAMAGCYNMLANCHMNWGYMDEAIAYRLKSLDIRIKTKGENNVALPNILNNLAACYKEKGDYYTAIDYHKKALESAQRIRGKKHSDVAMCYYGMGNCYDILADRDLAVIYFKKAISIIEELHGKEAFFLVPFYTGLGTCYTEKKQIGIGILYYKHALLICERNGSNTYNMALLNHNLADSYADLNEFDKAIACHEIAYAKWIEHYNCDHETIAFSRVDLGQCYSKKGEFDKAIAYMQEGLSMIIGIYGQQGYQAGQIRHKLAEVYWKQGNLSSALTYCQQSIQSLMPDTTFIDSDPCLTPPDKLQLNHADYLLEVLCLKSKILLSYHQQEQDPSLKKNYLIGVVTHQKYADELVNAMRQSYKTEGSRIVLAEKAKHILYEDVLASAWAANDMFPQTEPTAAYNLPVLFAAFQCPHVRRNPINWAFYGSEKTKNILLLSDFKESEARINAKLPAELLKEEYRLRTELAYLDRVINHDHVGELSAEDDAPVQQAQMQKAAQEKYFTYKQQYDQLMDSLEKDYPEYHHMKYDLRITDIAQIQAALDPQSAMIVHCVCSTHIYSFSISATTCHWHQTPKPDNWDTLVQRYLEQIKDSTAKRTYLKNAHALYSLLLEDNLKNLPQTVQKLIVIPDEELSQLPFDTFLTQKTDFRTPYDQLPYLLRKYALSYHYSATLWLYRKNNSGNKKSQNYAEITPSPATITTSSSSSSSSTTATSPHKADFLGIAPVYAPPKKAAPAPDTTAADSSEATLQSAQAPKRQQLRFNRSNTRSIQLGGKKVKALLESENEIIGIANAFEQNGRETCTLLHEKATLRQVKQQIQHYRYVVIAAHADYNDQSPQSTGILLSPEKGNGFHQDEHILFMGDAYALDLNADLVVLSCCDTGVGQKCKGEGVRALNRGFLFAGADNVVYTLFKIYDSYGSLLTRQFFDNILNGMYYTVALQQAKLAFVAQTQLPPVAWAGYVLSGEDGQLK